MQNRISFTTYFNYIKILIVLILFSGFFTAYFIENKQESLFDSIRTKYIAPQGMLMELKNTYDTNILGTITLMQQGLVKPNDAIDILKLAQKLILSSWSEYYDVPTLQSTVFKANELKQIQTFHAHIDSLDQDIGLFITMIERNDTEAIHGFIHHTLIPKIAQTKYLLDDLILYNIASIHTSRERIQEMKSTFVPLALIISTIITLFMFLALHAISKKVHYLNKEIEVKANDLSIRTQELEHATKTKSDFLAYISDELKTPLDINIRYIDMLCKDEESQERLKYLKSIKNNTKSQLSIISDIVDYSHIETKNFIIKTSQFLIREPFEESTSLYRAMANEKNITINLEFDSDLPQYMVSDNSRIKQIINNLLKNAIRFSYENSLIFIEIRYIKEDDLLECHVIDHGEGIANEDKKNLLHSFIQHKNNTQGIPTEFGLGLSISKDLITLMGGEIVVSSSLKLGSDFYFSLPIHTDKVK